ncbi:mannitol dehydrogenase family protein [Vibrio sp.]|nr:mannitol dehydrogenase family protein [Vibrio sp.]
MNNEYTWLHIGLGSFHRAHQAWYMNQLIKNGDNSWAIAAGNIRNDAERMANALKEQAGRYILETISPKGECAYEEINSIQKILSWEPDLTPLIEEGAQEKTKVIAFTVTEGGYYLDTSHQLDKSNSSIMKDLSGGNETIYAAITKILAKRIELNTGPVTLLCCDNVRHNGERFHGGLIEFLTALGRDDILQWMDNNVSCPNTMVDRITPRPAETLPERIREKTGTVDKAPVMGESFIQWVIEDHFIAGRPNFESIGVELVESVVPYEEAKIRILNSSHSCIAWAGTLLGQSYIHESTLTESVYKLAYDYVTQDVIPCLGDNGIDLENYRDVVLERFTNPHIQDTNQRVAADGLSKIPAMITPTLVECYERGDIPKATAMLPALFFVYMEQWHNGKLPYEYQDGILNADAVHQMYQSDDPIHQYATDHALFSHLADKPEFESLLRDSIQTVYRLIQ